MFSANCKTFPGYSGSEHPVEKGLERATRAKDQEDVTKFKEARSGVLEYLESQYKDVLKAGAELRQFVWDVENEECSFYEPNVDLDESDEPEWVSMVKDELARLVFTLEQISNSFARTLPKETKILLRRTKTTYDFAYDDLPRERLFKNLNWALTQDLPPMIKSKEWMVQVAEDMYAQYLEIRKAHKSLFDFDRSKDYGSKIDPHEDLEDEPLQWEAARALLPD
jgi:hypothetical protein